MLILGSKAGWLIAQMEKFLPKPANQLKLALVGTAANVYEEKPWFHDEVNKFKAAGFDLVDVDLEGKTAEELREAFANVDGIFVSGGNSYHLLDHARLSGFETVLKEFLEKGGFYIGSSAGALLVGPNIDIARLLDANNTSLDDFTGLNVVDFAILPHQGIEKYAPKMNQTIEEWKDASFRIIGLTDQQAIVVRGNLVEYISI